MHTVLTVMSCIHEILPPFARVSTGYFLNISTLLFYMTFTVVILYTIYIRGVP